MLQNPKYREQVQQNVKSLIREDIEKLKILENCDLTAFEEVYKPFETLRSLTLPKHFLKITKMVCSIYENLIVLISSCGRVDIFNYEYFYGLKGLTFPENTFPTNVAIIDGYQILILSCSNGCLYFFQFIQVSQTSLKLTLIEKCILSEKIYAHGVKNSSEMSPKKSP